MAVLNQNPDGAFVLFELTPANEISLLEGDSEQGLRRPIETAGLIGTWLGSVMKKDEMLGTVLARGRAWSIPSGWPLAVEPTASCAKIRAKPVGCNQAAPKL
jgi:hypothetical protein